MRTFIFTAVIISLLFGCKQSPRKEYYLLNSTTASAAPAATITQSVGLGPIEVAEYLHRSQVTLNSGANSLQMTNNAYWGEPLQNGITRVLAINLMNHQPARLIETFPWRSDSTPAISIRLQVHELQIIDGNAVINASWKLVDNLSKKTLAQHRYVNQRNSSDHAAGIANAYSDLLAQLATDMNASLVAQGY